TRFSRDWSSDVCSSDLNGRIFRLISFCDRIISKVRHHRYSIDDLEMRCTRRDKHVIKRIKHRNGKIRFITFNRWCNAVRSVENSAEGIKLVEFKTVQILRSSCYQDR